MSNISEHLAYLITRAKKMAGNLGRVPTPLEFQERFKANATSINMRQARAINKAVSDHTKIKEGREERVVAKPRQKTDRAWGR